MSILSTLGASWRQYYHEQDTSALREHASPQQTASSSFFIYAIVPALCQWPTFQTFMAFDWRVLALLFMPVAISHALLEVYARKYGENQTWFTAHFIAALYFQFVIAMWVTLGSPQAAPILSSFFVLTLVVHGYLFQYTVAYPVVLLCSALTGALAMLANVPSTTHIITLCFSMISGLVAATLVGNSTQRRNRIRLQNERLRQALHAEELARKHEELHAVSNVAVELLGYVHDVRNAVMVTRLQADALREEIARAPLDLGTVTVIVAELGEVTERLEETVHQIRFVAGAHGSAIAVSRATPEPTISVPIHPILVETQHAVHSRYRDRHIAIHANAGADALKVRCAGDVATLRRVFENLLLNACQGDGSLYASHVNVDLAEAQEANWVEITVTDDGPGFPTELLSGHSGTMRTTKANGTGIGLLTSERLVSACGGTLSYGNLDARGARVTVRLPREGNA